MVEKKKKPVQAVRVETMQGEITVFRCTVVQERLASDEYWKKWRRIYGKLRRHLKRRKVIQRIARTHQDPIEFAYAVDPYLEFPADHPAKKYPEMILRVNFKGLKELMLLNPDGVIHPEIYLDSWGKVPTGAEPSFHEWAKRIESHVHWLAVLPTGPKPRTVTREVRAAYEAIAARGHRPTANNIARKLYGPTWDQRKEKQADIEHITIALRRYKLKT